MMLDYNTLLIALGVSSSCLVLTLLGSWLTRRQETFLLTCTIGLFFIVIGIVVYSSYVARPTTALAGISFALFSIGFSTIWTAGYQFRRQRLSRARVVFGSLLGIALTMTPMLLGYDGLAYMFDNAVIAFLLFATAREYWLSRAEAPVPLYGISGLYTLCGITFVLCGGVLISDGKLVIGKAPENWAEDLSIAVCIAGMTGIGSLSLALHQWRQAALHRTDALTDSLTGLMNRRAIFNLYGSRLFTPAMAAVVFDIDRFKAVNDDYGHAAGDGMLKLFADELTANLRGSDVVARLGGEEFALVLDNVMPGRAEHIANRIRVSFATRQLEIDGKPLKCTVSAGIAFGSVEPMDFDRVLLAADKALYAAKRGGRNRVEIAEYLHAVPNEQATSEPAASSG